MNHSLIVLGPSSLTELFSLDSPEHPEDLHSSIVYTLATTIEAVSPPYQFDEYAAYVCENLLPDLNLMMVDSGLLVVLCFGEDNITPLAVWGGAGQMTRYSILLCIVSESHGEGPRRFEMPTGCRSTSFAAVVTAPDTLDRIRDVVAHSVLESPREISLSFLLDKLGA